MATTISDLNIPGLKTYDPKPSSSATKAADGTSTTELQANFLKMLTVQLQNQDPMNPMDNAQMTSQLAQLNMVDGINNMNKTMASMVELMRGADFMNYAGTVGRSALISGNEMYFDGKSPVSFAYQFAESMPRSSVQITDAAGNILKTMDLGVANTELKNMFWDGLDKEGNPVPAGTYRVIATGTDGNKQSGAATFVSSLVAAVGRTGPDIKLTLSDGKTITPKDVVQWVIQ